MKYILQRPFLQKCLLLLLGVFIFLYLFDPIETEDVWWHLSTGKWIVEHWQLPHVDIFSFGDVRAPWSCHNEWLGSSILYLVFKIHGLLGLKFFRSLYFVFVTGILFFNLYKRLPFLYVIIFTLLVALGVANRNYLKPDMFNVLFIQFFLINLFNYEDKGERKYLWFLPVVMCIWFNVHLGSLIYGMPLVSIFFLSAAIRYFIAGKGDAVQKAIAFRQARDLALTGAACLFSFLLNPYGVEGFLYPFKVFLFPDYIGFFKFAHSIQEMQPPWYIFHSFGYIYYFVLFALALTVILFNKKNLTIILLLAFSTFAFLYVGRNSAFYTIVCAYVFVFGIRRIKFDGIRQRLPYVKIIECLLCLGVVLFLMDQIAGICLQKEYINGQTINKYRLLDDPSTETLIRTLIDNKITGPVFNADELGGEMIWMGYPELRPFRDGRNNSYERSNNALVTMFHPKENWATMESRYHFKIVVLAPFKYMDEHFLQYLNTQPSWQLIAVNGLYAVYVKRGAFNLPKELDGFEASARARKIAVDDLQNLQRLKSLELASVLQQRYFYPMASNIDHYLDYITLFDIGCKGAAVEELVNALKVCNLGEFRRQADIILKYYSNPWNNLGLSNDGKGNYKEALEDYKKAIELNPRFPDTYFNRGVLYAKLKAIDLALRDFTQVITLNPYYAQAYSNRGSILAARGNFKQALLDYTQAVMLDSKSAEYYLNRGNMYNKLGRFTEALADYKQVTILNPNDAVAYDDMAVTYYQLRDYNMAWAALHQLEELSGNYDPKRISSIKKALTERK